jgi:S1-C subfamily serine protease
MCRPGLVGLIILAVISAGCQTVPPPPQAVATTPLAELPTNIVYQLPTAIPDAVVDMADAEYQVLTNIYERLTPSVVNIEVIPTDVLLDIGRGSGFVYDTAGHIVTNAHVVAGASRVQVTFNSGYVTDARIVGTDSYSDLAVLKVDVDEARLFPVTLADSSVVRVGERAIAIGNPFGLASSMTLGIVSGLGRSLPSASLLEAGLTSFSNPAIIQVDTDINPGNSGGPLLNSRGQLIGVNVAIRTDTGFSQGVGFAVPSNTVRRVVPELIRDGRVNYAWIGISTPRDDSSQTVAALAEPLQLPVESGVLVTAVTSGSPADKAGLRGGTRLVDVRGASLCAGGDIIVAINNVYVRGIDELLAYLVMNSSPGDEISLLIVRGSETFEIPLILEPRPTDTLGEVVDGC